VCNTVTTEPLSVAVIKDHNFKNKTDGFKDDLFAAWNGEIKT